LSTETWLNPSSIDVCTFNTLEEAIEINNSVRQGLSSSLFTNDMKNVFKWTSASGSDCGIVNVNQSTSGAEVSAAFGGNKVRNVIKRWYATPLPERWC
jgi:aldehyde dehydrogenase family 7 protein A1